MKFLNIHEETNILGERIFRKVTMNLNNKQALVEGLKQLVRSMIFLVISWLLSGTVVFWIVDLATGTKLDESTKLQLTGAMTLVLQYIDKTLHESDIKVNGLLPKTTLT